MAPTWLAPNTSSVASTAAFTSVLCKVMPCGRAKACTRVAVRSMRSRASVIICTYSVRWGSSFTRSPTRRRQFCTPSSGLAIWWAMPATSWPMPSIFSF